MRYKSEKDRWVEARSWTDRVKNAPPKPSQQDDVLDLDTVTSLGIGSTTITDSIASMTGGIIWTSGITVTAGSTVDTGTSSAASWSTPSEDLSKKNQVLTAEVAQLSALLQEAQEEIERLRALAELAAPPVPVRRLVPVGL